MFVVTVVVITYNSSKYVIDTLNSVFRQTYHGIQLIISDDCSTDDTPAICLQWMQSHSHRFISTRMISTPVNSGIAANYNNALKHIEGRWTKYIAGDDYMTDDCIEQFVTHAQKADENEKMFICGTMPFSKEGFLPKRILPKAYFEGDARKLEKIILKKGTIIEGPTMFIETATLRLLGGFDEKYPFIEDYPFYMKLLAHNYVIRLIDKHLIYYREYPESVSRSNINFTNSIFDAIDDYALPAAKRNRMYIWEWHYYVEKKIRQWTKEGIPSLFLYLIRATDIIAYKSLFK